MIEGGRVTCVAIADFRATKAAMQDAFPVIISG